MCDEKQLHLEHRTQARPQRPLVAGAPCRGGGGPDVSRNGVLGNALASVGHGE